MAVKSKGETIVGFAVRAGKVVYGADNIEKSRKIRLIICDKDLSENTLKKMVALANENKIKLLIADKTVEELVFKTNVKAIALTDAQMSEAIIKNISGFCEKNL